HADGRSDLELTGVGGLLPDDHPEQRRLADPVGPDDTDDAGPGQAEREPAEQLPIAEALLQAGRLEHDVAQPRAGRDVDLLEVQLAGPLGLGGELLVALQPSLVLGLPGLRVGPYPLQLLLEDLGPFGILATLDGQPLPLRLQVRGVVALVRVGPAAV